MPRAYIKSLPPSAALSNVRIGRKNLARTNTLAYFDSSSELCKFCVKFYNGAVV